MDFSSNNKSYNLFVVCCLCFLFIIPRLNANIAEYDDYWKARELKAIENLNKAYHPQPENVTNHINDHIARSLSVLNGTRRNLKGKKARERNEPCEATNPIDQCWRCDPNWERNRKKLADCVLGFGQGTTGGRDGEIYVVTDCGDDPCHPKPGTLRFGVTRNKPLWIIFERDMVILLKEELIMTSDKTIDGRGVNVHLTGGAGIMIQYDKNVIIENIHVHDIVTCKGGNVRDSEDHMGFRTESDGDGISLFGATNVWIDHVSMYRCSDGVIDAIQGSTAITISNSHFTDHNDVMLFGASDGCGMDDKMQVTLAFNHFGKGLVQRMPRIRFGFVHVVNNDYTHWIMYALGGSKHPTIISQGNRYVAGSFRATKEVTKRDCPEEEWSQWTWSSEGDVFEKGAYFTPSGDPNICKKFGGNKLIPFQPGEMVPRMSEDAGTLICEKGKPC